MAITYHVNKEVLGLAGDADAASVADAVANGTATTATNITNAKSEILTAVANAGVQGEIKLVINATGTAPSGTTKIESLPADSVYGWLNNGEIRVGNVPKAFAVSDSANMKYVFAVNANEDFITFASSAGGTAAKRFLSGSAYIPTSLTLSASVADGTSAALTDTGYYVYSSTATTSYLGYYITAPGGTSSVLKLVGSFSGFGTRGYVSTVNLGSTVLLFNGGTTRQPTQYSQFASAGAWELNPATSSVTTLSAPPFQSTFGASPGTGGLCTCSANNEAYVVLTGSYSEDAATLVSGAPTDAIPVYKLSSGRVWSKLGNMLSPYTIAVGTTTQVKSGSAYVRAFYANSYLWLVPYVPAGTAIIGLVRINTSTGAQTIVEVSNLAGIAFSNQMFFHNASQPAVQSQAITSADGTKVYFGISNGSNASNVASLANATSVQPLTAFYVKKN